MRERLRRRQCARKTPRGVKSALKGVWETVKAEVKVSLHRQIDEKMNAGGDHTGINGAFFNGLLVHIKLHRDLLVLSQRS